MENVSVTFVQEEKEFIRMNYRISLRQPVFVLALFVAAVAVAMLLFSLNDKRNYVLPQAFFWGAVLVYMLIFFVRLQLRLRRAIRSGEMAGKPLTYTLSPQAFHITGKGFEKTIATGKLHSVREFAAFYMVFLAPNSGFYIPKRTFTAPEQEAAFRKILGGIGGLRLKLR